MNFIINTLSSAWQLLLESSIYILFGLLVSGILRVFLSPASVGKHLGHGRFKPVFKAAFLGIPIPLCSCGVLPAAVSIKKQGANNGATTAFLISTPESGVDSIAITYALLDPIMTIARPVVAFITATVAGILENLLGRKQKNVLLEPDLSCPVDGCCDGLDCPPDLHAKHHSFFNKIKFGLKYALTEVWADIASWFFLGLILAGLITSLIPGNLMAKFLGGGIHSMLLMLAIGIPLYICATASTPIAAALILKGVSPGAALVFLLAGPATNITSLTVLFGVLGKRAAAIYLATISVATVLFGLLLDGIYGYFGISAQATISGTNAIIPQWLQWLGAFFLLIVSVKPIYQSVASRLGKRHAYPKSDFLYEQGNGIFLKRRHFGPEAGQRKGQNPQ
ncbi:MAG: SO_0444 family Cu/Zn efflux transporter [Deltaproteobacteria bacterium]|nr:SO_0444 family Cu/Zn efflux transporter [Deltaproteobacteria bacterium]MBW1928632.1 SO_0444 family Cu/Zn efflux transporter [Deltaproteobacteria bacterium]MBW2024693.1 SO_0444 family Cu/Zn efflux transporter [Deltaproteobacteria bacterium]MBW2125654.1 SO_0444 family Cu/Zn efflux transporter [Deltaproteobacteria bacterium]RLB22459.1 MAG: permease [Deltaproteobacteria bacterium]